MNEKFKIGRLAMRQEGNYWVGYYAKEGTLNDAILLGSIAMGAITGNPDMRARFMDLMRDMVSDVIEDQTGKRPTWGGEKPAPECERAGRA